MKTKAFWALKKPNPDPSIMVVRYLHAVAKYDYGTHHMLYGQLFLPD
jgi:hypothetical protein